MIKKKKRRLKVKNILLMFVFLSVITLSVFFVIDNLNPYKEKYFIDLGYQSDEVVFILKLDDAEKDKLLSQNKIDNIIKHYTIEHYTELINKGYTDEETLHILRLDASKIDYVLNKEYINDLFKWLEYENFIFRNFDRYLNYQEKNPSMNLTLLIEKINTNRDYPFYTNTQASNIDLRDLILVNKYYALSEDFSPTDLVSVSPYGNVKLSRNAAEAFIELCKQAKEDGYTIIGISGYRSYQTQKNLYNRYLQKDPQKVVDTYSAKAGHSEHQTGLAIDVSSNNPDMLTFEMSSSFIWMKENAHQFGYILRYLKGKEDITGYKYEPWHYRFVGKEIATLLHQTGMTYDEYVAINLEN